MKIESLSVNNFKGLKSIELEPRKINLITGRNNTGKSSLLEAINMLYNPRSITHFGDNYTKLIRENFDSCEISASSEDSKSTLVLEKIEKEEIWEEFVLSYIEKYINGIRNYYKRSINYNKEEQSTFNVEKVNESIREILESYLDNVSPSDILMSPLILKTEDNKYPFVKSKSRTFIDKSFVLKRIENEIDLTDKENKIFRDLFIRRFPFQFRYYSQGFIRKTPENSENVKIIKELNPRKLAQDEEEERVAVKEDDIEDYIKEKGLVKDLKSFNLNQLVFTKNGEKYGVPYEFMGDGFKAIVGILWNLLEGDYDQDVVLIEEPENHMHPGYTRELVYFLIDISREHDTQFFITTHDRDFIESFFGDNIDEKDFLKDNFLVINMKKDHFQDFDYGKAEYQIEELLKDLRGI